MAQVECLRKPTTTVYRPRRPRSSPLYQILEQHFDRFCVIHEEEYEREYGPLRPVVRKAVEKYLECGILENGFARVVCGTCKAEFLVGFSCRVRMLCPSCHAKRLTIWSEWLGEVLLENVPHRMITLTVPKRIRPFFLWDRKLLGLLARCAAETIKTFYREMTGEPDGTPGMVVSVQTFGNRAGNYHPHIHCLATDGVHLSDDTFVRSSFLPPVDIAELFRREVLRAFLERELITESVAENMLSWPHSGFHVHLGPVISGDEREELKRTARYGARAPLALSRLTYDRQKEEIAYTYTNPYDTCEYTEKISPYELIARLVTHIPDPWEHTTRNFGWYSNRTRGVRKKCTTVGSDMQNDNKEKEARAPLHWRRKWAELLRLVFEVTLSCPRCGTEMKIISVLTERELIRKILTHLKEKGVDARAGPFEDCAA
jgi:hypothetical protein